MTCRPSSEKFSQRKAIWLKSIGFSCLGFAAIAEKNPLHYIYMKKKYEFEIECETLSNYRIHSNKGITIALCFVVLMSMLLSACAQTETRVNQRRIKVVASTTIVGEFVHQIGGEYLDLVILIPAGADPHTFEPRPQDIAAISEAKIVFINGFGLEEF